MNDFFDRLEGELVSAAGRRSERRRLPWRMRWTRRAVLVLLPASVLLAGSALAKVTGFVEQTGTQPGPGTGPQPGPATGPQTGSAR